MQCTDSPADIRYRDYEVTSGLSSNELQWVISKSFSVLSYLDFKLVCFRITSPS